MTHKFLISTAAAALLAGTVLAAAQGTPQAPTGGAMERNAPAQTPAQTQGGQDQMQPKGSNQGQPRTTGQGQPKSESQQQGQTPAAQGQGQGERQGQPQRQPEGRQGQSPDQGQGQRQPQQGAQQKSGGSSGTTTTFTTEQRTKIRETVIRSSNAPRVTNVNFSVNVGAVVPTTVKVVAVPDVIIEVHPEWRGHMYFIVEEKIIIVDRNHKIVAVLTV